jgi:hypothetical protein
MSNEFTTFSDPGDENDNLDDFEFDVDLELPEGYEYANVDLDHVYSQILYIPNIAAAVKDLALADLITREEARKILSSYFPSITP